MVVMPSKRHCQKSKSRRQMVSVMNSEVNEKTAILSRSRRRMSSKSWRPARLKAHRPRRGVNVQGSYIEDPLHTVMHVSVTRCISSAHVLCA
jgi:hypothetical protein